MANVSDILKTWRQFALEGKSTLAANWYLQPGDYRSGHGMVLSNLTRFIPDAPAGTSLTRDRSNSLDPVLGCLPEMMNGPFYAGDKALDVHVMGVDYAGRPVYPLMLSRDMAKFGPGAEGHPAAPWAFLEELARPWVRAPYVVPCFIRYFERATHPHFTGKQVDWLQGRWGVQSETSWMPSFPPGTPIDDIPITGPDPSIPPGDSPPGGPPPGSPPPGGPPGDEPDVPYYDDIPPGEVRNPLTTHMLIGGAGFRPYIADPAVAHQSNIQYTNNPRMNVLERFLRWAYVPGVVRGYGAQAGNVPGTGTGGVVFHGSDLTEQDIYNPDAESSETPHYGFRQEAVLAFGGIPALTGAWYSGTLLSQDPATRDIEFQAVDDAGADDPLPRLRDNGDLIARVHEAAGAPTVNDDEDEGYLVGDGWEDTTGPALYLLTDSTPGAAVWVEIQTGGGSGDVVGPASATDSAMVEFDGTTGKLIKDGGVVVTAFAKTVLDDTTAAAARATLGASNTKTTSTTSHDIGIGSKTFTTAVAMDVGVGAVILVTNSSSTSNFMIGRTTAISGTSITILMLAAQGSGTGVTTWTLEVSGFTPGAAQDIEVTPGATGQSTIAVSAAIRDVTIGGGDSIAPMQTFPAWFRFTVTVADVIAGDQGAGVSFVDLAYLDGGGMHHIGMAKLTTAFVDGGAQATEILLDVGDVTTSDDSLVANYDVMNSGTGSGDFSARIAADIIYDFTAQRMLRATFTMDAGSIANLTDGEVVILVQASQLYAI